MFLKHFSLFLLYLVLRCGTLVYCESDGCSDLDPCGKRGVCVNTTHTSSEKILSTRCICALNYTGRWCQFVDGDYKLSQKGRASNEKLNVSDDVPESPTILNNTKVPDYGRLYTFTFRGVKDPASGQVLYYLLRYNYHGKPGDNEWKTMTVPAKNGTREYKVTLKALDWEYDYDIELYAGNKHGVSRPTKGKLQRPKVCKASVDLTFLLDGSSSVRVHNFNKVRKFVKSVISSFIVGEKRTRIAVVVFGITIRPVFNLRKYFKKSDMLKAVDKMEYPQSLTFTGEALDYVRHKIFVTWAGMRKDPGIPKVLILITDGRSNGKSPIVASKPLRDKGVRIFSIGVNAASRAELNGIATDPDKDHVFLLKNFNDLAGFVKKISYVSCQVDGGWSPWSRWSRCSASCNSSIKSRTRTCTKPAPYYGGKDCQGESKTFKKCHTKPCPINGGWSVWSEWSSCSASCNPGVKSRTRNCSNPVPQHGGLDCPGEDTNTTQCLIVMCKVHGVWSSWSKWSNCSASCNSGVKSRIRNCTNPAPRYGGNNCEGENVNTTLCNTMPCKVHGGWSSWSEWSNCSASCNSGIKSRTRNCTNPAPRYGGNDCGGENVNTTLCNTMPCKVHGGWSFWSEWSHCSASCNAGVKSRTRNCTNPAPRYGGNDCEEESVNTTLCNTMPCKVHGGWSKWSRWSSCSASCNSGVKTKKRSCSRPAPQHGGKKCRGKSVMKKMCNIKPCEGEENSDSSRNVVPFASAGGAAGLLIFSGILYCCYRVRRKKQEAKSYKPIAQDESDLTENEPWLETASKSGIRFGSTSGSKSYIKSDDKSDGPTASSIAVPPSPPPPPPPPPPSSLPQPGIALPSKKRRSPNMPNVPNIPQLLPTNTNDMVKAALRPDVGTSKDAHLPKLPRMRKDPKCPPRSPAAPSLPPASETTYEEMVSFERAALESGNEMIRDAQIHRIRKHKKDRKTPAVCHGPSTSPSSHALPLASESTYGELVSFDRAVLESGSGMIKDAEIHKTRKHKKDRKASGIPQGSTTSCTALPLSSESAYGEMAEDQSAPDIPCGPSASPLEADMTN